LIIQKTSVTSGTLLPDRSTECIVDILLRDTNEWDCAPELVTVSSSHRGDSLRTRCAGLPMTIQVPGRGGAIDPQRSGMSSEQARPGPHWVIHVISSERKRLPLVPRFRTYRCVAETDEKGQRETSKVHRRRVSIGSFQRIAVPLRQIGCRRVGLLQKAEQ